MFFRAYDSYEILMQNDRHTDSRTSGFKFNIEFETGMKRINSLATLKFRMAHKK
jgi:hypothetical protein